MDGTSYDSGLHLAVSPGKAPSNIGISSAWGDALPATSWTVANLRSTLFDLQCGNFSGPAQLAESVVEDCIVFGAIEARLRALSSRSALPFKVEVGTGDGRILKAIRDRVEQLWWSSCREDVIEPILRDTVLLGVAVGRIYWRRTKDEWIPILVHLSPHSLEFEEWSGFWYYTGRDGIRHHVTPGDGRWFLHLPHGRRSFVFGAIRAIGEPWLSRRYASRDSNRWCERHGLGVLKVKEPHSAHDDVEQGSGSASASADAVYKGIVRGMVSGAVIRLPQGPTKDEPGWDADFIELDGTSLDGIEKRLQRCADEIETALLGRPRGGNAKGGDGEQAGETARNENLSSDAEPLSSSLRDCVWKPYVAYNYGSTVDLEVTPWGRWVTTPPTNLRTRAETLDKLGTALPALQSVGVDLLPVLEEFALTAPGGVKTPPKPEPTKPAQAEPEDEDAPEDD